MATTTSTSTSAAKPCVWFQVDEYKYDDDATVKAPARVPRLPANVAVVVDASKLPITPPVKSKAQPRMLRDDDRKDIDEKLKELQRKLGGKKRGKIPEFN